MHIILFNASLLSGFCIAFSIGATAPALSQSSDVERCNDPGFMKLCPVSCAKACDESDALYNANLGLCEDAIEAKERNVNEPQSCKDPTAAKNVGNDLSVCVANAAKMPTEPGEIIEGDQQYLEFFNAFFSEMPSCAGSIKGLTEMYSCLDSEAGSVSSSATTLPPMDFDTKVREQVVQARCKINNLPEIVGQSRKLEKRAKFVSEQLNQSGLCRKEYSEWIGTRDGFCGKEPGNKFPFCGDLAVFFNDDIKEQLKVAEKRNQEISDTVGSLNKILAKILFLGVADLTIVCQKN